MEKQAKDEEGLEEEVEEESHRGWVRKGQEGGGGRQKKEEENAGWNMMKKRGDGEEEEKREVGKNTKRIHYLGSTSLHDITVGCLLIIIIDGQARSLVTGEVETFDT